MKRIFVEKQAFCPYVFLNLLILILKNVLMTSMVYGVGSMSLTSGLLIFCDACSVDFSLKIKNKYFRFLCNVLLYK